MDAEPAFYKIRVQGHLAPRWTQWLGWLGLRHEADGTTLLWGHLPDQAALHGALNLIHGLGLTLICVSRLASDSHEAASYWPGDGHDQLDMHAESL